MKLRFSSLDVCAMVTSLHESLIGYRCANVYDINPKTYVIKLQKPDSKLLLLIEAGVRVHITKYAREKGNTPSGMTLKLRKHMRSKRIERVQQLGTDRVVVFTFGSPPVEHHLIVELYDRGNLILTNSEHQVLTLLRNSKHDSEASVTVKDVYPIAASQSVTQLTRDQLETAMQAADPNVTLRTLLLRTVPVGKELIEHCLLAAGLAANLRMSAQPWLDPEATAALLEALRHALRYFDPAVAPPPTGLVVLKDPRAAATASVPPAGSIARDGGSAESVPSPAEPGFGYAEADAELFDEFAPYELLQHRGRRVCRFETFWEAVDEFFAQVEKARAAQELAQQHNAVWRKVDKIRSAQDERIEKLRSKEEEDRMRGELLEFHLAEVDELLGLLRAGLENSMDWEQLGELIDASARQGDALAAMVHELDLPNHAVTIALEAEDDDGPEEDLTRPALLLKLDIHQSASANARTFFTQKKAAAAKTAKTAEAAELAVKAAEVKAKANVAKIQVSASIRAIRSPFWFEKFSWFVSSENFLVLAAHDGHTADLLIKRHLQPRDIYVMADTAGASPSIIKQRPGCSTVPPLTLQQAGTFVLCRSNAWTSREVTSAWWVPEDQALAAPGSCAHSPPASAPLRPGRRRLRCASESAAEVRASPASRRQRVLRVPPEGARLDPGCFLTKGVKHYLPPAQLIMGMAVLFKVQPCCVSRHLRERRVRTDLRAADEADEKGEHLVDATPKGVRGGEQQHSTLEENVETAEAETEESERQRTAVQEERSNPALPPPPAVSAPLGSSDDREAGESSGSSEASDEDDALGPVMRFTAGGGVRVVLPEATEPPAIGVNDDASLPVDVSIDGNAHEDALEAREAGADALSQSTTQSKPRMTAKQRRDAKKARSGSLAGTESASVREGECASAEGTARDDSSTSSGTPCCSSTVSAGPTAAAPVRGKKGKMKKLKERYADQDEEDRQLLLSLLGSAGKSKQQIEREAREKDEQFKKKKEEAREQRLRERRALEQKRLEQRQQEKRQQKTVHRPQQQQGQESLPAASHGVDPTDAEGEDEGSAGIDADVKALLEEPSIQSLDDTLRSMLTPQDTLTGCPLDDEELLYALPVCAPYSALANYKFRVKLTPGSQKKGKAARQAIGLFCSTASVRERELCVALKDDELVRPMLGNVKVVAPGLAQAARSAKNDRKASATSKKSQLHSGPSEQ